MPARKLLVYVCALAFAMPASAQFIEIKTVPIATGEQFMIFPSRNMGFGSLSISVRDPLLDPFSNPARGSRLRSSMLFGAPTFYGVSDNGGSGRTLPAGAILRSDRVYGGLMLSFQQLQPATQFNACCFAFDVLPGVQPPRVDRSAINQYAFGMLGTRLGENGVSVAGSAMIGLLDAMDGIDLLYPNAFGLAQNGSVTDLRLGLLREREGAASLEGMFVFSNVDMTHDVQYLDFIWDPVARRGVQRLRSDHNRDRTHTYGLHFAARSPESSSGVSRSAILTANYKHHPSIPNYDLMAIPRDPGFSFAYNIGGGIGRDFGPTIVGIEAVLEPIWSHTWANADQVIERTNRSSLQPGDRTVENDFVFRNAHLRTGVQREIEFGPASREQMLALQLGLGVTSINYHLTQRDNVQSTRRTQKEQWLEWTPSWGATLRFSDLELRYVGRQRSGTGRPGVMGGGVFDLAATSARSDILLAPSSQLTLMEARVRSHQVSVSIPLH
jgi:hypothetical protein